MVVLWGFVENWVDDKKGEEEGCRGDEGVFGVIEMVIDCMVKLRGV